MLDQVLRDPRQLRFVFLGVMFLLASTLSFLGWILFRQDRQLSEKKLDDQRETAATLAAHALENRLSRIEEDLSRILETGVLGDSKLRSRDCPYQ